MFAILSQEFFVADFPMHYQGKTHRILFGSQSQKRLPGIWCWDPSQECVFVISVGRDFCDGFSCSFPRKINQKKESIRKMPAILSQEFCDGSQRDPSQNIAFCSVF